MPSDSLSTANYAAVIQDLRAKRDELDRTIAILETMARIESSPVAPQQPRAPKPQVTSQKANASGNTGLGETCAQILRARPGEVLSSKEVTTLVLETGFPLNSTDPVKNVWSALKNRAKRAGGTDIERVGERWRYAGGEKAPPPTEAPRSHTNGMAAHA